MLLQRILNLRGHVRNDEKKPVVRYSILVHELSIGTPRLMLNACLCCAQVFIGPYEHHSNMLPWRESGADVVVVQEVSAAFLFSA